MNMKSGLVANKRSLDGSTQAIRIVDDDGTAVSVDVTPTGELDVSAKLTPPPKKNRELIVCNMLIRRLIAKGFIRIEQLNKRKVQYLLTPQGFAEKMRKSVNYTLKTINSIGLIKARVQAILLDLHKDGTRDFFIVGKSDLSILIEMVAKEFPLQDCSFCILDEIPQASVKGTLLICKENVPEDNLFLHNHVDLIRELAKKNHYSAESNDAVLLR